MVVSMETRKIPEKLRQEFSEIDEFGTQILKTVNFLGTKSANSQQIRQCINNQKLITNNE